jgi:hypothetical protein
MATGNAMGGGAVHRNVYSYEKKKTTVVKPMGNTGDE